MTILDIKKIQDRLDKLFSDFEKAGYYAQQKFWCCQSCGINAIPDDVNKYIFYHEQDYDTLVEHGQLYLAWGGDGTELMNIIRANGMTPVWSGKDTDRIMIKFVELL